MLASKLRKDELEAAIKTFLHTGKAAVPTRRCLAKTGPPDVERGLRLDMPVIYYTSNKATKNFLVTEAKKLAPGLKKKSGARYRLNRWREEQLTRGVSITYGDLVRKYVELNQTEGRFERVPVGRYINFMSDFLAREKGADRKQAIAVWKELKRLDAPKTYAAWKAQVKGGRG